MASSSAVAALIAASIIPFLIGGTSATTAPDTFLRYDTTNGVVPLAGTDYAASLASH